MATRIASLYAEIGADVSGFKKGIGYVDRSLKSTGKELGGFTGLMGKAFPFALGAATAGMTALGAAVYEFTDRAADMQQAVANIAADMSLTADETAQVSDLISDLGIDPKLKVTADEAAAAIHALGKNGQDLATIMDGTARATVLLANSTGGDFATSADLATDIMAQFKIGAADMMTAVNGITGTTQFSKFGIDDYRLAVAQAGGVAASVGVSFEDFNATIAAISPLFASGSDAGTSFKTFLQRLIPQSKEANELMRELGIITADGTNRFFDASGQMKSMSEIAGILNTAFSGLSEEQKINAASTIFGTDAMRAAFAIADAGSGTIEDLKKKIGNVDAEKAAETRMNTLKGSYEIFTGIVDTLAIKIGERFTPRIKEMIDWLTKLATEKGPMMISFVDKMLAKWDQVFPRLAEITTTNGGSIISDLGNIVIALDSLFNYTKNKGPEAVGDWAKMFTAIYDIAARTASGVTKIVSTIIQSFSLMKQAQDAATSGNWGAFNDIGNQFNNLISGMQGTIIEDIAKYIDPLYWLGYRPEGRASGGRVTAGGVTLVGERGPELVDLPGGSYVHNATESAGVMGGSSSRIDLYVHAASTMPTDRSAIRELAIALQRELNLTGARVVIP